MRISFSHRPRGSIVFLRASLCLLLAAGSSVANNHARAQGGAGSPPALQPVPPSDYNIAEEPTVRAVAQVMPAVVNIATERVVSRRTNDPVDELFNRFFGEGGSYQPRETRQRVRSLGSGFLVDADGTIVTNEHVVERAADMRIQVTFADGTTMPARYLAGDRKSDLALIRVDPSAGQRPKPFLHIDLNNPSPNLLGQTVLALGNPVGYNSSVSRGILSAKDREITVDNNVYKGLLQTDAAINPGNSGGPLIDLAGRLVGVNSVKMSFTSQGTPTQGLGFAIPAKTVAAKVVELKAEASNPQQANRPPTTADNDAPAPPSSSGGSRTTSTPVTRQLFGLSLVPASGGSSGRNNNNNSVSGVTIADVEAGSPADRAGIKPGMILVRVGTYEANSPARIEALLKDVPAGTMVDFVISPGGRRLLGGLTTETVTLRARSSAET
ncbi:MAG: trypsin-like peptidase domain-containing protein [Verrucomicrobia bacterium]|nr:trypsin-like peptidase domain-containing protein [Verrucomicrobiota bacterium]